MFSDPTFLLMYFGISFLLGNIVGGTVLFALVSHAQVINEM